MKTQMNNLVIRASYKIRTNDLVCLKLVVAKAMLNLLNIIVGTTSFMIIVDKKDKLFIEHFK